MHLLLDWVQRNPTMIWSMVAASLSVFVGSLVVIPWLLVRMPADYFLRDEPISGQLNLPLRLLRGIYVVLKNGIGLILVVGGMAMLVLPGQGMLTLIAGLLLMSFPGKRRLERWFIQRPAVHRSIDWIRKRAGEKPLQLPRRD